MDNVVLCYCGYLDVVYYVYCGIYVNAVHGLVKWSQAGSIIYKNFFLAFSSDSLSYIKYNIIGWLFNCAL